MPPPELARLVDTPRLPSVSVSPAGRYMLLLERPILPAISELAGEELRLGGIRFDPRTSGPSRSRSVSGMRVRGLDDDEEVEVTGIPEDTGIGVVRWSPDEQRIAFTVTDDDRISLYVAESESGRARQIEGIVVHNVFSGSPFEWLPDSRSILVRTVPEDRGPPPMHVRTPSGPLVRETDGTASPSRTHADLLSSSHEEALFEHYVRAQLAVVNLDGNVRPFAEPMLVASAFASPDGEYVLVESIQRPFSHLVPAERFPRRIEVYDRSGNRVHTVAETPAVESLATVAGSVQAGPRIVRWREDAPATLSWVEARDGGDAGIRAAVRDEIFLLPAPFDREPDILIALEYRYAGLHWGRGDLALVAETWPASRIRRVHRVRPDSLDAAPELVLEYATDDRYAHPGYFVLQLADDGSQTLVHDGDLVFLTGSGPSPEGNRPFLRSLDVDSGEIRELFRSEDPYHESPVEILSVDPLRLLTRRETTQQPPNYVVHDISSGTAQQITDFPHPYPDLAGIQRQFVEYEREDGVRLGATVYLPPGYDANVDGPLPGLMWAYPRSFRSADAAGQVSGTPNRFTYIGHSGAVPFVTQGYAIMIPSMPVIGDGDEDPNDRLVEQLVMNARAAIEAGASEGFLDPERVAVGGHSYGAFMTANLLAHSDLFRAGIAQSGAYNRTLTPFGFQAENRSLWDVPEAYIDMSPFMHADGIDEPILIIHGAADPNQGTFPMQSERLYDALRGLGKTARLVMLPEESHTYSARESVLHVLWEMHSWLERHVRNAPTTTN